MSIETLETAKALLTIERTRLYRYVEEAIANASPDVQEWARKSIERIGKMIDECDFEIGKRKAAESVK